MTIAYQTSQQRSSETANGQCPNLGHHERSLQTVTPDTDPGASPAVRGMDSGVSP